MTILMTCNRNSVKEDYSNDQTKSLRESVCQLTLVNPKWISNPNKIHQWRFYEMVYEHIFGKNRGKIWSSKNVNLLHKNLCHFYSNLQYNWFEGFSWKYNFQINMKVFLMIKSWCQWWKFGVDDEKCLCWKICMMENWYQWWKVDVSDEKLMLMMKI